MKKFNQLTTVNHQGTVIAFGREADATDHAIYYNTLELQTGSVNDNDDWAGFTKLAFPSALRPAGSGIITINNKNNVVLGDAGCPFRVVTDQQHVCVFRQSTKGTLLVNRYLMKKIKPDNATAAILVLEPVWEIRYERSGKEDIPAGNRDTMNYTGADGIPFIEPVIELYMISQLQDGRFDVAILHNEESKYNNWQFFAYNAASKHIDLFSFPMNETGLFDLTGKAIDNSGMIVPDRTFSLQYEDDLNKITPLTFSMAPSVTYYAKQERIQTADHQGLLIKRSGRLMLAVPVKNEAGNTVMATVDFGISKNGRLSEVEPVSTATSVKPANYTLYFDEHAYIQLENNNTSLSIASSYEISVWIYPYTVTDHEQRIIGGPAGTDEKAAAPFISLVNGHKIKAGFGNGAKLIQCITQNDIIISNVWYKVTVQYDAEAEKDNFKIFINDNLVDVKADEGKNVPCGTPVALISNNVDGFTGLIDNIMISTTKEGLSVLAGHWPFDVVNYNETIPFTPDESPNKNKAFLYGPKQVPSTSPVITNSSGAMQIDANGLTTYVGALDFVNPLSSPDLLDGSDGFLHMYFQGQQNAFNVVQYDVEMSRAIFQATWLAHEAAPFKLNGNSAATQTGGLNFVASRSGTYMNQAMIKIEDCTGAPDKCNIHFNIPAGTVEHWKGVPRRMDKLIAIINGQSVYDPADPLLKNGQKVFYDAQSKYPVCYLPVQSDSQDELITFITRLPDELPLYSIEIKDTDSATETCTAILQFDPAKWNSQHEGDKIYITQTWPHVPIACQAFINTLNGIAPRYDYRNRNSCNTKIYGITAATTLSNEANHIVLFFTQPTVGLFEIKVTNGETPATCDVHIYLEQDDEGFTGTWKEVPRSQVELAQVLNGGDTGYDYGKYASGAYSAISQVIIVITDRLTAAVLNHEPQESDLADMLGTAGLFDLFNEGDPFTQERVTDRPMIMAGKIQGAWSTINNKKTILLHGSTLFGAVADTQPVNGLVPMVQDTSTGTDGIANLVQYGTNGGWIEQPPQFDLQFNGNNAVMVDVDKPSANELAINGDMSVELWCRPSPIFITTSDIVYPQRLLNFNRRGNNDLPENYFQYTLGLLNGYCLEFDRLTRIHGIYKEAGNEYTLQLWMYLKMSAAGDICVLGTEGFYKPHVRLTIDQNGYYNLVYGNGPNAVTVTSLSKAPLGSWVMITGTVAKLATDAKKVELALYVGTELQQSVIKDFINPGAPVTSYDIGSLNNGVAMLVNGACAWNKALPADEIIANAGRVTPDYNDGLVVQLNLAEGTGSSVANTAQNGVPFTAKIDNQPNNSWRKLGIFYHALAGNRSFAIRSKQLLFGCAWEQIGSVYYSGYALQLNGSNYADCGKDSSLNMDEQFSIEAWVQPNGTGKQQSIISKGKSYEVLLNTNNSISFNIYTSQGLISLQTLSTINPGQPAYLACTFITGPVEAKDPKTFNVIACIYLNGVQAAATNPNTTYTDAVSITSSTEPLLMGSQTGKYGFFTGAIADVRLWNRVLTNDEIADTWKSHRVPAKRDGLLSWWRFSEMKGRIAYDMNDTNNARLSSNELWALFEPSSIFELFVGGKLVQDVEKIDINISYGGYGPIGFGIGSMPGNKPNSTQYGFNGEMDEIRIWNTTLTPEQITDNMYRTLSGTETGLAGYWKLDAGSGTVIDDQTGKGNDGRLMASAGNPLPVRSVSEAPLTNESQQVYNILGGVKTRFQKKITEAPSVIEYADTQFDAYGNLFSIMKRCYVSAWKDIADLEAGYKVGDLDTVYVGQVQTKPTVIGYFEGAPPVPSENQTMPFWIGDTDPAGNYAAVASIQLNEADETVRAYTSSKQDGSSLNIAGNVGVYLSSGVSLEALGVSWNIWEVEGHLGYQADRTKETTATNDTGFTESTGISVTDKLTLGGDWENKDQILNPAVGRRYVPDNVGYALVKSLTSDLYIVKLKGSNTMVKMTVVPNADIPEEVNIITFPINAKYIKNGTLDGKVGLKNDPDYPDADLKRGSYFQPLQAYTLKRQIERQDKQLEAFYTQFNTKQLSNTDSGYTDFREQKLNNNPAYDWTNKLSKRNMVNTYVWTATGGLHTIAETVMDSYSESYGHISSDNFTQGLHIDFAMAATVGFYGELDVLWGTSVEVTSIKSKEQSDSFNLDAELSPDGFLKTPVIENDALKGYTANLSPGKVESYRFMTFYLAPAQEHFDTLKQTVIDQNWLNNSKDPNAAALREATTSANGAWRVLHRVTFVGRIPPEFQPVAEDSQAPDITPPANLPNNIVITSLIQKQIPLDTYHPSPVMISKAVLAVLGESVEKPGLLAAIFPWWTAFLQEAANRKSTAYQTLYELKLDMVQYMIQKYDTDQYNLRGNFPDKLPPAILHETQRQEPAAQG